MDTLALRRYREEAEGLIGRRGPLGILVFVAGVGGASLLEYGFHPERQAFLAFICAVELAICLCALAYHRWGRRRWSSITVTRAVHIALLSCVTVYATHTGASASALTFLFIAYVFTSALLFAWDARDQAVIATSALVLFGFFIANTADSDLPVAYELLGVVAAALLSILGSGILDRQRRTVFAQREQLDRHLATFRDLTATLHGLDPQRTLLGVCQATLNAFHLRRLWVIWMLAESGTHQGYVLHEDGEALRLAPLDDADALWAESVSSNADNEARFVRAVDPGIPASLRAQGVRDILYVPLAFEGERLGLIYADRNGEAFELHRRELALASVLASGTAIAMANARLYQQMITASAEKSIFLARTAHELRNPLHALLWDLDQRTLPPAERLRQHARATLRIAEELQDLAEVATKQIAVRAEPLNTLELFDQLQAAARIQLGDAPVRLQAHVAAGAEIIVTDPFRVRQVLGNLLSNAVKFTTDGAIELEAERCGSAIVLSVRDTGPGIEPAELSAIFTPFRRSAARARTRGLGLGLAIAREIATILGGRIEVDSIVGIGSTFRLHLPASASVVPEPLAPATRPETAPATLDAEASPAARVPAVLVIEDDDLCRTRAARALADANFRVVEARDGFDGLRQHRLCRPDLVILDLDLPGIDGREVLATLSRDRPDLPVIISSGVMRRDEDTCFAWLAKPYSAADLIETARDAVFGTCGTRAHGDSVASHHR